MTEADKGDEGDYDFPQEMDGDQWVEHFWSKDFLPFAEELNPDKYMVLGLLC